MQKINKHPIFRELFSTAAVDIYDANVNGGAIAGYIVALMFTDMVSFEGVSTSMSRAAAFQIPSPFAYGF